MAGQTPGMGAPPVFQGRIPPPQSRGANTENVYTSQAIATGRDPGRFSNASGTAAGASLKAALVVFVVDWVSPRNPSTVGLTYVTANVLPNVSGAATLDVQIQSATNVTFTAGLTTTTLLAAADEVVLSSILGPFTNLNSYYFRARGGDFTSDTWGLWSPPVLVTINTNASAAAEMVDMNIGYLITYDGKPAAEMIDHNIGLFFTFNGRVSAEMIDENVTTTTPTPFIYAIRPTAGRAGDGVTLLGQGFGASQAEYSGVVEAYDEDTDSWSTVPVTSWIRVAATAAASTEARAIEPYTPKVDPEHEEIEITVPISADPPSLPLRVRTNGP